MPVEVKVPSVGESITSGVLGVWNKKAGDYVQAGDILFEVETDKVTSEVYADVAGTLQQLVSAGTTVQVGQVVAVIDEKAPAPVAAGVSTGGEAKAESVRPAPEKGKPANGAGTAKAEVPSRVAEPVVDGAPLSPAARYQLAERGLSPADVTGTGKGGRILKSDILEHTPSPQSAAADSARTTRKPMSPLRRRIADRLLSAQQEAAILTTFNEVDMSNIIALRSAYQERFTAKHGIKLGFMSFFVRAVIQGLKAVQAINAKIEDGEIVENHYYDIGVAISTEKGLLVPVIRDADRLSLAQIEMTIAEYAKKARAGKITLAELEGGVFTITNGGIFGSLLSTPILNPPQSGILGMHTIQERPVAVNGRVEIRPMMYLALSYDHRLVDGREAVTFLVRIKELVENPGLALLDI